MDRQRAVVLLDAAEGMTRADRVRIGGDDEISQLPMQIGAVDLVVRRAVFLQHFVAAGDLDHQLAGLPVLHSAAIRTHAETLQNALHAECIEYVRRIRTYGQSGPHFAQTGRLLVHDRAEPERLQGTGGGQSGDSRPGDGDLELAHGRTMRRSQADLTNGVLGNPHRGQANPRFGQDDRRALKYHRRP